MSGNGISVNSDVPDRIGQIKGTTSGIGELGDELLKIHQLLEPVFKGHTKDTLDPLMIKLCDSLEDWMQQHHQHSDRGIQKAEDIFEADRRGASSLGG
ncbi:MAG: hypothetical protein H6523_15090 [Mycolicibacterium sp.]|nr:hypothetical protein [Mycolicibacterium sp.]